MDPDSDSDPDHSQKLTIPSLYLFRHFLKIPSKSVHKFLSYLVHKYAKRQTNPGKKLTSLAEVITISTLLTSEWLPFLVLGDMDNLVFTITSIVNASVEGDKDPKLLLNRPNFTTLLKKSTLDKHVLKTNRPVINLNKSFFIYVFI